MDKRYKYSEDQLREAVKNSNTWCGVMRFLNSGWKGYRGSQSHIKDRATKLGLDHGHFLKEFEYKRLNSRPIEDYLSNEFPISSNSLKKKLLGLGLKNYKCESCQGAEWLGEKIPLELHHIDHNPNNNSLVNLLVVCCNCHKFIHDKDSSTLIKPNEKQPVGVRVKVNRKRRYESKRDKQCLVCGRPSVNKYCSYKCSQPASRKVIRPSKEELEKMVWETPVLQIIKNFGLKSSNSIKKWCKDYGIIPPPRGYWSKVRFGKISGP